VFLCRIRAAFDPAPAPVLEGAVADMAPIDGWFCANTSGGAAVRKNVKPIEAKIALRIVVVLTFQLSTEPTSLNLL
jgi:hypothetical protein